MKTILTILLVAASLTFGSQSAQAADECHSAASFFTPEGETTTDTCGNVHVSGNHTFHGDLAAWNLTLAGPIVEIVESDHGYALIGQDGGVFVFGDFTFGGSVPGLGVYGETIVTAVNTSTGYVLVSDTGVSYVFRQVETCESIFSRGEWMTVGRNAGRIDPDRNPAQSVPIPDVVFDMACLGWGEVGQVDAAVQMSMCEAQGDQAADNGADFSMWQINRTAHRANIAAVGGVDFLKGDVVQSTMFARNIYDVAESIWGYGWQPWTCAKKMRSILGVRVEL